MGNNKELGQEGERLAEEYLLSKGYHIEERNFRSGRAEIDLIASKNELLVFVEVKTRTRSDYGMPEDSVDERKAELITDAAENYIDKTNWKGNIRFDIIAIIKKDIPDIQHFEDAFY
jgi:putative endonuclease